MPSSCKATRSTEQVRSRSHRRQIHFLQGRRATLGLVARFLEHSRSKARCEPGIDDAVGLGAAIDVTSIDMTRIAEYEHYLLQATVRLSLAF